MVEEDGGGLAEGRLCLQELLNLGLERTPFLDKEWRALKTEVEELRTQSDEASWAKGEPFTDSQGIRRNEKPPDLAARRGLQLGWVWFGWVGSLPLRHGASGVVGGSGYGNHLLDHGVGRRGGWWTATPACSPPQSRTTRRSGRDGPRS